MARCFQVWPWPFSRRRGIKCWHFASNGSGRYFGVAFQNLHSEFWAVMAPQPAAQSVEPREQNALRDIALIKLVAAFPFQVGWNDQSAIELRVSGKPLVHASAIIGKNGEQRVLVDDAVVDRGWFKEEQEFSFFAQGVKDTERLYGLMKTAFMRLRGIAASTQ